VLHAVLARHLPHHQFGIHPHGHRGRPVTGGGLEPGDQRAVLRHVVRGDPERLTAGLEAAARHGAPAVDVSMDSELVIRQMTGQYKVKNAGLKPLHQAARAAAAKLRVVRFTSVPRADNARADAIVNETLDRKLGFESPR